MNSTDINNVINNLCDKLGTTVNNLIPEMAGYQIAKSSIWLVISLIFIGVCVGLTIKIVRMNKADGKALALYPNRFREIDEKLKAVDYEIIGAPQWAIQDWRRALNDLPNVTTVYNVDESTYCMFIMSAILSGLTGVVIFGIALMKIIGWSLSPHAMTFMWIIGQIGGGQ